MALNGVTHSPVHFGSPPLSFPSFLASFLTFSPPAEPPALPPTTSQSTLAQPFNIDPELYVKLLDFRVPLTIGAIYAVSVSFWNKYNASRKNKATRFSKTRLFFWFVIVHNVFLAIYSAWTCFYMARALKATLPALGSKDGLVGVVDSLCKMQGPRGLNGAVTYNPATSSWGVTNQAVKLLGTSPDPTDVGRLWNEGLGYYGWLFYLSKFYEVFDTMIILLKGKKSSLLQTYHHTGAMLCMWAGIRYMSPPIWMFVLVNSGIHALMYSYYTLSALSIKVPKAFKQSLTTLQITQFLVGASYALIHLLIAYDIPVQKPYIFINNVSSALPTITSSVAVVASASAGAWLKKLALRAVGGEGPAEKVTNEYGEHFGFDPFQGHKISHVTHAKEEIRYQWENATTHCVDTPGQAYAIYLNVLYLAPLTYLFVQFFIRSYLKKASKRKGSLVDPDNFRDSSISAVRNVNREVLEAMSATQGSHSDFDFAVDSDADIKSLTKNGNDGFEKALQEARDDAETLGKKIKDAGSEAMSKSQTLAKDLAEATQDTVSGSPSKSKKKKNKDKKDKKDKKDNNAETNGKPKSFADVASAGIKKEGEHDVDLKMTDDKKTPQQIEEEAKAKDLVERAYAAANNAASAFKKSQDLPTSEEIEKDVGDIEQKDEKADEAKDEETKTEEVKDEAAYEANIDETTSKEEKEAEKELQPPGTSSSLFN